MEVKANVEANVENEGETSMARAEGQPETAQSAVGLENPWLYLPQLFAPLSVVGNTFRFKCLLCLPKKVECSAYKNSPSNLKKHVERVHPVHVDEYEKLVASSRKRKAESTTGSATKKTKQLLISQPLINAKSVTQSAVNRAIANVVVGALLPLSIAEVPEFKELITTLQPNRHVLCPSSLRALLVDESKSYFYFFTFQVLKKLGTF